MTHPLEKTVRHARRGVCASAAATTGDNAVEHGKSLASEIQY